METSSVIDCSGALICARNTHRFLLLQKNNGKHNGKWGLAGGTHNLGETAWQGLQREITEELGFMPDISKTIPLERFVSNDSLFNFRTYFCVVDKEFIPILTQEHRAWGWFNLDYLPKPTHKGLESSLKNKTFQTKLTVLIEIIENL
ncbi:NUDIX hydrolase [bacterium]|nr:NUDIX hydrolase [bacterium]